jgi:hypothetical protein
MAKKVIYDICSGRQLTIFRIEIRQFILYLLANSNIDPLYYAVNSFYMQKNRSTNQILINDKNRFLTY